MANSWSQNLDDALLSSTLANYARTLEDNVFNKRVFLNWLTRKNRVNTDGGESVVVPLLTGSNSTSGVYAGYDTISTTPQEGLSTALYPWYQAAVSISISGIEEAKNAGSGKGVDLVKAKFTQAEESLSETLNSQLLVSTVGTGTAPAWTSLAKIIDSTGTIGGIDSGTYTWWAAKETAATTLTLAAMSALWNDCHAGTNDSPDFILTTDTQWEKYESLLQPQLRYSDPGTADAGFMNLLYKGAPVTWDLDVESGILYMVNSKYLELKVLAGTWFKTTPFIRPSNQDARYAQVLCYGSLTTNNRRRHGKLTGLT